MTECKLIVTLLLGVSLVSVAFGNKSALSSSSDQPIGADGGRRRIETPEVVLQLKYESGELDRIYLTQFRKEKENLTPSVPARTDLCSDLCHAGLGGDSCGSTCLDMLPVGLQLALVGNRSTEVDFGQPRVGVCPTLCHYNLGKPLCDCGGQVNTTNEVNWSEICTAFCVADNYVLGGCPECEDAPGLAPPLLMGVQTLTSSRVLDTTEGWVAWCGLQCRQGQGGAACNCDRPPFS